MSPIRWRLADDGDDGQGALFEEEVERHVGKGEFRGLEFLHVIARRIINEIPPASHLPFRFTINAYRGCSHACTYCNPPKSLTVYHVFGLYLARGLGTSAAPRSSSPPASLRPARETIGRSLSEANEGSRRVLPPALFGPGMAIAVQAT